MLGFVLSLAIVISFIVFLNSRKKSNMDQAQSMPAQNPQATSPSVNLLDEKIKTKFKLFQGLRSAEEDQKILDKVSDMCFNEMLYFVAENLTDEQRAAFESETEKAGNEESRVKVFTDYLSQIPEYQNKLNERMDNYLDKVVETSLNFQQS